MSTAQRLRQQRQAAVAAWVECPTTGRAVLVPPGQHYPRERIILLLSQN